MSQILIAGASGLIGRELIAQLPAEEELTLLCRKPGNAPHHWLPVDFDDLASVTLSRPVSLAFCALGTTRKAAGSAEKFRHVDLNYVLAFADLARRHGCQRLIVVSSIGANARALALYPRTKGEMEQALLAQSWLRLAIVRPAMLLGERQPPRLSEQLLQAIYPLFRPLLVGKLARWRAIETKQVARAMIALSKQPVGIEIIENEQLLTL
ncbi:MAG: NAD(P)H-binding protein [Aeromonas sp.]